MVLAFGVATRAGGGVERGSERRRLDRSYVQLSTSWKSCIDFSPGGCSSNLQGRRGVLEPAGGTCEVCLRTVDPDALHVFDQDRLNSPRIPIPRHQLPERPELTILLARAHLWLLLFDSLSRANNESTADLRASETDLSFES